MTARPWEEHAKGYRSTSDEVWDRSPVCSYCEHAWPCDTALAADEIKQLRHDLDHVWGYIEADGLREMLADVPDLVERLKANHLHIAH